MAKTKRKIPTSQVVSKKIAEIVRGMGGGKVQVGWFENATYPNGTPVAFVAFMNEYGHGGKFPSPPRPAIRGMINAKSRYWPARVAQLAKLSNYNGALVLAEMGENIASDLRGSIADYSAVPLSPTTLRLREVFGNHPEKITITDVLQAQQDVKDGKKLASGTQAKPLVWTGQELQTISFEVIK